ncbi:MAG: DUF3298 and DUF4163 domain-containing protein [Acetatifactor sp.]|nr:DUF3298 and DUF4163 domain-containing protein [Acetatifactor sp.]
MGKKSGICTVLLALCLTLGGCGAQEEKRHIDIELWSNRDYSLWNQELGQIILECPYDEVRLLSEGYEELERALEVLNAENADYVGSMYERGIEIVEEGIEKWNLLANTQILPFSYSRKITVLRSDETVVSLFMEDYAWAGGLHPNYYGCGVCFDPLSGQRLRLADVVTDYDRIYELVLEQLSSEEYMDQDGNSCLWQRYEETVKQQFYPQESGDEAIKWYLDTEGLKVLFDAYELAPYSEGGQILGFSFEELGNLIKPQYICGSEE